MRGLRYRSSPSLAPADLQPVRLLSYLTALNKGGHPWTKTQPPATGSSIPPPAWSTSPTCCPQNSNVSRSRTSMPASTNGATTAADAPSATAGVTTTAPRHHAKAIRPRPSRPTCGSANSRTGSRQSPSQSSKTPCTLTPASPASSVCRSSAWFGNNQQRTSQNRKQLHGFRRRREP